jgi:predicted TIM-barrel fold metal-dependent hydrolase
VLKKEEVEKILQEIREIGTNHLLTDVHVHPFEVLFGRVNYRPHPGEDGLFSSGQMKYRAPQIGALPVDNSPTRTGGERPEPLHSRGLALAYRSMYAHTGPKAFADQMALSGIRRSVLLPIARDGDSALDQMELMAAMFGGDERFVLGYCVPNSVAKEGIAEAVRQAVQNCGARIVKIHPSISGVNPASREGKERIELILKASARMQARVIVHGGMSSAPCVSETIAYGTIVNLRHIDWNMAEGPVIFAHAGAFGYPAAVIRNDIFPILDQMMANCNNIFVDSSGMNFDQLKTIVDKIDAEKIIFGSDSLYFHQWRAVCNLFLAIKYTYTNYLINFVKICSANYEKIFPTGEYGSCSLC